MMMTIVVVVMMMTMVVVVVMMMMMMVMMVMMIMMEIMMVMMIAGKTIDCLRLLKLSPSACVFVATDLTFIISNQIPVGHWPHLRTLDVWLSEAVTAFDADGLVAALAKSDCRTSLKTLEFVSVSGEVKAVCLKG